MVSSSRTATYSAASARLAQLSDQQLAALVEQAVSAGSGIGGDTLLLDVDGTRVFVKAIPLTARERVPANRESTANLFDLPAFCHYGIGSPGFGAWRELALHQLTTRWVLDEQYGGFPLLYDWRVLPSTGPRQVPEELRDTEAAVRFWGGSEAVGERLSELATADSSLMLFLEYLPQNVDVWLTSQLTAGAEVASAACTFVDQQLREGVAFMNDHGLLHFDAHFENILTDGRQFYFSDFGLALHSDFALSPDEAAFFQDHLSYDRTYTSTFFVRWLNRFLDGLERTSDDQPVGRIPQGAAAVLTRHAPISAVMTPFYHDLQHVSRSTAYPVQEIARVYG